MKNKITHFFILVWTTGFLLFPGAVKGESDLSFSLEEAQIYALKHAYSSKDKTFDIETAKKDIQQTISTGLPQIKRTFTYQHNIAVAANVVDFGGVQQEIKFGTDYNATLSGSVEQMVFDGTFFLGLRASRVYLDLAKNQKEKNDLDVKENAANAYFLVLAAEKNRDIMKENLENSRKNYKEALAYYKNGFREIQDAEQMELLVKQAETNLANAEKQVKSTRLILKFAMGMDINKTIRLKDPLALHMDKAMPRKDDKKELRLFNHIAHIDYRIADTQTEVQRLLIKKEKLTSPWIPKVTLFYNHSYTAMTNYANVFSGDTQWRSASAIGLKISFPVKTFGGKSAALAKAKINYEKALNRKTMTEQNLKKEYATAKDKWETSLRTYDNAVKSKDLAKRIYDKTVIKFNNGLATSTELNQNQNQYLQAYGQSLDAMTQLLANDLRLRKLTGNL